MSPCARAESMHFWGETLELDAQSGRLEGDQARLFWGDYQLLANQIIWDAEAQRYLARGQVTFRSAVAEVKAETLQLLLAEGVVIAEHAELHYLGKLSARAVSLWLSEDLWLLEQVNLRLNDSPLQLQADKLRLLPRSREQLVQLENLRIAGSESGLSPALPYLEWSLLPEPTAVEIQMPVQGFQPQLGWQNGQLQLGLNTKIWQNEQQRLYLQAGGSLAGFQGALSHEWRPRPETVINSQLGWFNQSPQGHVEALTATPLPVWLAAAGRWQEVDHFAQQFWLPELVQPFAAISALELVASSEYSYWGELQYRYLLGARWSPTGASQAGASLLGNLPLLQFAGQDIWGSLLVNGFYEQGLQGTLGVRLLDRWLFSPEWLAGLYLEQYLSSWSAGRFLQSDRLTPWLGGFVRWTPQPDLALALESALSLSTGQVVLADALLTWRIKPIYLNLMLRGIPVGLQLQLQVDDLGF